MWKSFETVHSHICCTIIQLIHEVKSYGCSQVIAKGIKSSRDLWMKDKNFLSSNFSSLKHCTNKNENLAFRQLNFSHYFPASSEGLHQLFFNSLSLLGLNRNFKNRKTSVYITKQCGLEHCWVLLSAAPHIKSSGAKCKKLCLSESQDNSQLVLIIHGAGEWDSQLFNGTVLNSKGIVFPIKRSDSKRRFMEKMVD